jgi:hypothetical protein
MLSSATSNGLLLFATGYIERHGGANELLEGRLGDSVAFIKVNGSLVFASRPALNRPCGSFRKRP